MERVIGALGEGAGIANVTAGLRALAQVGDPRADIEAGLLTAAQLERVTGLFGRGAADRVVIERAMALEARLRALDRLGSEPSPLPRSALRVIALDRGGTTFGNAMLGTYVTVSLTHLLRQAPRGRPWRHTLCLAGADRLGGEVLDRLCDACESTRTGLVLAYRSIPAQVRERLGRGNAAVAFMRLGNAEDAKVAAEQIGTEHRFVLSQLTDTVGASVTGTSGWSYTSTVGDRRFGVGLGVHQPDHGAEPGPRSHHGRRRAVRGAHRVGQPGGERVQRHQRLGVDHRGDQREHLVGMEHVHRDRGERVARQDRAAVPRVPGRAASAAAAATERRHRQLRLPAGRQVVLADANPAILALPTVSMLSLDEAGQAAGPGAQALGGQAREAGQPRPGVRRPGRSAGGRRETPSPTANRAGRRRRPARRGPGRRPSAAALPAAPRPPRPTRAGQLAVEEGQAPAEPGGAAGAARLAQGPRRVTRRAAAW